MKQACAVAPPPGNRLTNCAARGSYRYRVSASLPSDVSGTQAINPDSGVVTICVPIVIAADAGAAAISNGSGERMVKIVR